MIRIRGGSTGSGSVLTEKGRALMDAYDGFAETLSRVAEELCGEYFGDILKVEEKRVGFKRTLRVFCLFAH